MYRIDRLYFDFNNEKYFIEEINSPSLPTIKLISAINSLLNIAAFRSRTVDFVACQFGSPVFIIGHEFPLDDIQNDVLSAPGEANGDEGDDDGALHGWVT